MELRTNHLMAQRPKIKMEVVVDAEQTLNHQLKMKKNRSSIYSEHCMYILYTVYNMNCMYRTDDGRYHLQYKWSLVELLMITFIPFAYEIDTVFNSTNKSFNKPRKYCNISIQLLSSFVSNLSDLLFSSH